MNTSGVRYHQGAAADVKSAVAWYRGRSPKAALDFVEELDRAVDTIREAPERWERAIRDASFSGAFRSPLFIPRVIYSNKKP
ncbi:MAG: type II toxin-antitoxin system RelE/ParE family toxin [Candidatus Sulfotelmatobacter sp.]